MGGSRRSCSWMICWQGFRWSGTPNHLGSGAVRLLVFSSGSMAAPDASTGTSRARRRVSPEIGTPRRARDPPIDDGDGLLGGRTGAVRALGPRCRLRVADTLRLIDGRR